MKIGYCLTGSFCTFAKSIEALRDIVADGHSVVPIMSKNAYETDTRFGTARSFIASVEQITGNKVLHTINETEPIGPKKMFDVIVVAPCTSNTLAKLNLGITDTSVTMAVKSHLRNSMPVVIGVSTNDALGNSGKNIGALMNYKNYYFVPMSMDDKVNKPKSMVCDFSQILPTIYNAQKGIAIPSIF